MSDRLPTTVFRTQKPKESAARFVVIDNVVVQDPRLSFRARGVLAYVLSKPTTWEHSAESLAAASTEGVEAIRSALRELERFGFAEFRKLRIEGGRFKSVRLFREAPDRDLPDPVNPSPVEPDPVKPAPGKTEVGPAEAGKSRLSESTVSENTVSENTEREKQNTETKKAADAAGDVAEAPLPFDSPEFATAWADWLAYRRERRLPTYKPTSIKGQFAALAEWGEAGAIASIRESIRNQWQGLFPPKNLVSGSRATSAVYTRAPTAADHAKGFMHGVFEDRSTPPLKRHVTVAPTSEDYAKGFFHGV